MRNWQVDHPQCPHCYTNRKGRTNRKGHQGYRKPSVARNILRWEEAVMRRPTPPPDGQSGVMDKGQMLEEREGLYVFLVDTCWDDGKPRRPGTITLFMQDGRWKLSINDRDQERFAIMSGTTLEECLDFADRHIRMDTVEWRYSSGTRGRRR